MGSQLPSIAASMDQYQVPGLNTIHSAQQVLVDGVVTAAQPPVQPGDVILPDGEMTSGGGWKGSHYIRVDSPLLDTTYRLERCPHQDPLDWQAPVVRGRQYLGVRAPPVRHSSPVTGSAFDPETVDAIAELLALGEQHDIGLTFTPDPEGWTVGHKRGMGGGELISGYESATPHAPRSDR